MKLNKEKIVYAIKKHWSNLTGCNINDFDSGITYILDSKNPKLSNTKKIKEEIQVLNYKNGGTIINVADECFSELLEIIQDFGISDDKIGQLLEKKYKGYLTSYHSVRSYLFTDEKLKPIDLNVRKLEKSENNLFDSFMQKCSEKDNYEVYMDFSATFHNFFAYFLDNDIVALGEYSKNYDGDDVVIISIIVKEDYRGKGYGKALVNVLTHEIIKKGLVPQYRAYPENTASRNLAKSLGYEELVNGYTLYMKQN